MFSITLQHFLFLSAILFTIGILGIFLNKKNLIVILMSIELILLSVNINFIAFSAYMNDLSGQIVSLFVTTIAAAEVAIGLAILLSLFKQRDTIELDLLNRLKW